MDEIKQWWAYLHRNGSVQMKRWWGDVDDYTRDCENNPFVEIVIEPFEADDSIDAEIIVTALIKEKLNAINSRSTKSSPDEIQIAFR